MKSIFEFYVYVYLDPRQPGDYSYGDLRFNYEPFYVGKGFDNRYDPSQKKQHKYLMRKINKISADKVIIIKEENLSEEGAFFHEMIRIAMIGRKDLKQGPLVNLTNGGEGAKGAIRSEKTKKKIRKARKNQVITEEQKAKIRESCKGLGKGRKLKDSTKEKLRQIKIGTKLSKEHKKKIGDSIRGEKNGFYGKKHSEESLKKMSESHKKHKVWNVSIKGYKNKPWSKETRAKMMKIFNSEEFREKISKTSKAMWDKKLDNNDE